MRDYTEWPQLADEAAADPDLDAGHDVDGGGVGMKWMKDKPTVEGAYWLRLGAYVSLVKVEPWKDEGVAVHLVGDPVKMQPGDWVVRYIGMEVAEPLRQDMGEWAGPLEEPSSS
jgi:hypothetical protein